MSLRTPQEEALSYLDVISTHCDYKKDSKGTIEAAATEYCEKQRKINAKFDFPSFCYAMATGIGKTRLMGACIYYLYKTKGYKHFFILAPGNTIYDKLRKETNPNHPKYIFKGLEAEMGRPKVYDGENYDSYPVKFEQMTMKIERTSGIQLFIFNIGKIFNSKTDTQFNFHKFKETLGASFADVLSQFDDLVVCMDEAHRYYAPASMKAINYLKPVLGLEFTATPKSTSNVIYTYDLARGAVEGYLKIVLPKYNAVIFVHGCFWHRHLGCKYAYTPKTRIEFWQKKFDKNIQNDLLHREELSAAGWRVFVVWECQLRGDQKEITLRTLADNLKNSCGSI